MFMMVVPMKLESIWMGCLFHDTG